jgi:hypothetical protein
MAIPAPLTLKSLNSPLPNLDSAFVSGFILCALKLIISLMDCYGAVEQVDAIVPNFGFMASPPGEEWGRGGMNFVVQNTYAGFRK